MEVVSPSFSLGIIISKYCRFHFTEKEIERKQTRERGRDKEVERKKKRERGRDKEVEKEEERKRKFWNLFFRHFQQRKK